MRTIIIRKRPYHVTDVRRFNRRGPVYVDICEVSQNLTPPREVLNSENPDKPMRDRVHAAVMAVAMREK